MADETLDQVIAGPREVEAGGRKVLVRPLSPRQIPAFLAAIRPMQDAIGEGLSLDALDAAALLQLAETHTEHVVQAVAVATREDADFIGDGISAAELVDLLVAVVEVNAAFFVQRMAPAMLRAVSALRALVPGPTPSSDS